MSRTRLLALLVALAAVLVAVWQRAHAVERLGQDFDEATYLPIAFTYAGMLEEGRWGDIGKLRENFEHPPLVKLLFAQSVRVTGAPEPDWSDVPMGQPIPDAARPVFRATRSLSAVAGVLQVGLVALVDPLGALLLAWDPYHTKYTSQAYLEAVPGLFACSRCSPSSAPGATASRRDGPRCPARCWGWRRRGSIRTAWWAGSRSCRSWWRARARGGARGPPSSCPRRRRSSW
ncbi:hypothetical protein [Corallococcus sp. 4LFB]|uniref:hypothetical protein n=1 Tax=Corallococcus sp. 4LFB TaxID=3383249 RepID=UPI0039759FD0